MQEESAGRKGRPLDLSGMRFGRLTAIRRLDEKSGSCYLWLCRCDCGREVKVRSNALKGGNTKSCGCATDRARRAKAEDISGRRFGKLVALQPLEDRRRNSVMWKCECDCGKEVAYSYNDLVYSGIKSCGCARYSNKPLPLHFVDGTCVEMLERKSLRRDNTSGYTGVVQTKTGWKAQIVFKKKTYYLGTYQRLEEAALVRKQAEENLHDAFLSWYKSQFGDDKKRVARKKTVPVTAPSEGAAIHP